MNSKFWKASHFFEKKKNSIKEKVQLELTSVFAALHHNSIATNV